VPDGEIENPENITLDILRAGALFVGSPETKKGYG